MSRMKIALQRVVLLLRRHPVLWKPVIFATALSYGVTLLLQWLTHQLEIALIPRHFISSGAPVYDASRLRELKAILLVTPITWSGEFLVICIFAYALVFTAQEVLSFQATPAAPRQNLIPTLLWFSAKLLIAYHLLAILMAIPIRFIPLHSLHSYVLPIGICGQIILTLIVAAMAIRFLARALQRHATSAAVISARWLGILTVAVSVAISLLVPRIQHPLFAFWPHMTQPAVQTILLGGDVISCLPYAPFFVALVFLLDDEPPIIASSPASEPDPEPSPATP